MTAGSARAQGPESISVRADNDAFNFWKPPYRRPDEEYTSGVRGSLVFFGAAPWERWLHSRAASCEKAAVPCATHTFSLGQDIYTGTLVPGDTVRVPGTRPNAAWLYVEESSRIAGADRLDETSVTLGVTGPPALGQEMQSAFHSIAPDFNRPINWSVQVPFEPGLILAYDRTQRILVAGDGAEFGGDVEPHAGASFGNILTEARAGLRVRGGYHLQHPWQAVAESSTPVVTFFADATIHGVLRNEFLAGTLFRSSPHVEQRPFVPEYQLGLSVRWRRFTLNYSLDQTQSEYVTRPDGHAWSRIGIDWRIER
jgi:hypothetical protein